MKKTLLCTGGPNSAARNGCNTILPTLNGGIARVYWFDDEKIGGACRIPKSWKVLYLENGVWKPAYAPSGFPVVKVGWSEVQFELVKTTALRIELQVREGVSVGVHEWEVH
jgi:uncharacterized protein